MPFMPVGAFLQATTATPATSVNITLSNQAIGDLILMAVRSASAGINPTTITGGGATWSLLGTLFNGVTNAGVFGVFQGIVTATGAQTATANVASSANIRCDGQEFYVSSGQWAFDKQAGLDSTGTATWPSLTPLAPGELYFGSAQNGTAAIAGTTTGYTYTVDANSNGTAWNPACTTAAQAPVWGDSGQTLGIAILVQEQVSSLPNRQVPNRPYTNVFRAPG